MSQLDALINKYNKEADATIISVGIKRFDIPKIPFSSPRANYVTYGGIPMYRLTEFSGEDSGGKTTSALDIIGNYQKLPESKRVLYIDHEGTYDEYWATKLGVDVTSVIVFTPEQQTAEQIFDMILEFVKTNEIGLIVIDSVACLLPAQVKDKSIANQQDMAGVAKPLTRFCKELCPYLHKYKCTGLVINQLRDDMNSMWGGVTTPGGKGLKHFCSLRLRFSKGQMFDKNFAPVTSNCENPYGHYVKIALLKSKVSKPDRRLGSYTLVYTEGIDAIGDTIDVGVELGYILKGGAWFKVVDQETGEISDTLKFQGRAKIIQFYRDNPEEYKKLFELVNNKICEVTND